MRPRTVLLVSLVLNLVLAAGLFYYYRPAQPPAHPLTRSSLEHPPAPNLPVHTNVVVRRQFFNWSEVESTDYPTYITNLLSIGCPESTVRDIIVADINQLYGRKRSAITITNDLKWWQPDPYAGIMAAVEDKLRTLDLERRDLLASLLGPNWETAYPPPSILPLTGPVLSALPPEVQQAVQEIASRGQVRQRAYIEAQEKAGKTPDQAELARLRKQTRDELAQVLTAQQLEEYLLRYSTTAAKLRSDLHDFTATPDEFRTIFRARDQIDSQIDLLYSGNDPVSLKQRRALENQREQMLKQDLGTDRYVDFKVNQDSTFRQAKALAEQLKAAPEVVVPIYEINHTLDVERQRIRNDATLSNDDRSAALAALQLEQEKSLRKILGDETFDRYQKSKEPASGTQ